MLCHMVLNHARPLPALAQQALGFLHCYPCIQWHGFQVTTKDN